MLFNLSGTKMLTLGFTFLQSGVTSYFVTKLHNILLLKQLSNFMSYFYM